MTIAVEGFSAPQKRPEGLVSASKRPGPCGFGYQGLPLQRIKEGTLVFCLPLDHGSEYAYVKAKVFGHLYSVSALIWIVPAAVVKRLRTLTLWKHDTRLGI
jgi:hypothetical protein